jgi:ABC-type cobalt transport system substrate-binding protein
MKKSVSTPVAIVIIVVVVAIVFALVWQKTGGFHGSVSNEQQKYNMSHMAPPPKPNFNPPPAGN